MCGLHFRTSSTHKQKKDVAWINVQVKKKKRKRQKEGAKMMSNIFDISPFR
jgi:hypothetical protein